MKNFLQRKVGLTKFAGGITICGVVAFCAGTVLAGPKGAAGDLYVGMETGNTINQYDGVTGVFVGVFADTSINKIRDHTFGPNGNLYVLSSGSGTVEQYDGNTGALIGTLISGLSTGESLLFMSDGTLLVSNLGTSTIDRYDATTGNFISTFASNIQPLQNGLIFGPNGNVFAGDLLTHTVHQYGTDGTDLGVFASGGGLNAPEGIAFGGPDGNLFVASFSSSTVVEFDGTTGALINDSFITSLTSPDGLRFGPNGNLWVGDTSGNTVNEFDPATGALLLTISDSVTVPRSLAFKPGSTDCLAMTVSALTGGQNATWDVSGATPGSLVVVVFGLKAGSTVVNGQLGFCATFGIKGVTQNSLVGKATADGAGNVSIMKGIPAGATGLTVLTQAAEQGTCPDECVSNLDTQVVQ